MATDLQPQRPRQRFPGISARAFEHPADRAALTALAKIPGFDLALRKLVGFLSDRSLRQLYLASAVRVSEAQLPRVWEIYADSCATLDVAAPPPELFVAQTPVVNAGAIGVDRPFIVLNSGTVALFSDDELRFVLGHELGHILAGHSLYKTMLGLLLNVSARIGWMPLGNLAAGAIIAGLTEWDRKSEVSCDRAGLLCVQEPLTAYGSILRTAGGLAGLSLESFLAQASEYESSGTAVDGAFRLLNLMGQRHPFHAPRLSALKRWAEGGEYTQILGGAYPLRKDDPHSSASNDFAASARSYGDAFAASADPLVKSVREMGAEVAEASSRVWSELKKRMP